MDGTRKNNHVACGLALRYILARCLLYPLVYYVVRYRRQVVRRNLQASFPTYSLKAIRQLERKFYRYFCNMWAEVLYGCHLSENDLRSHIRLRNVEQYAECSRAHGGSILLMAHIGNWEWLSVVPSLLREFGVDMAITYRQQKNVRINAWLYRLRSKWGGILIDKNKLLRQMITLRQSKTPITYVLIADQRPRPEVTHVYTQFLHQRTGFLSGGESLAKKFDYPVFYAYISMPSQGMYEVDFRLIADQPNQTSPSHITCEYAKLLENNIIENPSLWLWTHNRWKWTR